MFSWFKKNKLEPRLPTPKDKYDRSVLADIAKVGWSVICIDDGPTPYQFSVGLYHSHNHPEIIISAFDVRSGDTSSTKLALP